MVSDVPVGAFLSGGLDSSAVVSYAREHPQAERLRCFTIGFTEGRTAAEGVADDLPYARQVVSDMVQNGGFPPFFLQPINFDALYAEQQRRRADSTNQGAGANA